MRVEAAAAAADSGSRNTHSIRTQSALKIRFATNIIPLNRISMNIPDRSASTQAHGRVPKEAVARFAGATLPSASGTAAVYPEMFNATAAIQTSGKTAAARCVSCRRRCSVAGLPHRVPTAFYRKAACPCRRMLSEIPCFRRGLPCKKSICSYDTTNKCPRHPLLL